MGLFDSIRDAIRPDDEGRVGEEPTPTAKHVDRSATPEYLDDPVDPDAEAGGKHARRD